MAAKKTETVEVKGKVADTKTAKPLTGEEAVKAASAEVPSNHNTTSEANPIRTAQVENAVDYNPQRRVPNKANVNSDTVEGVNEAKDRLEEKATRPTAADMEAESKNKFGERMKGGMSDTAKAIDKRVDTSIEGGDELQSEIDEENDAASPGEKDAKA